MNVPVVNSIHRFYIHFQRCILLIVLGVLVYGNHLQNPFQFDTVSYVSNHIGVSRSQLLRKSTKEYMNFLENECQRNHTQMV